MSWYAGGSLWWTNSATTLTALTARHPTRIRSFIGGVQIASGPLAWTSAVNSCMGDETEFGIVLGANMNQARKRDQVVLFRK